MAYETLFLTNISKLVMKKLYRKEYWHWKKDLCDNCVTFKQYVMISLFVKLQNENTNKLVTRHHVWFFLMNIIVTLFFFWWRKKEIKHNSVETTRNAHMENMNMKRYRFSRNCNQMHIEITRWYKRNIIYAKRKLLCIFLFYS